MSQPLPPPPPPPPPPPKPKPPLGQSQAIPRPTTGVGAPQPPPPAPPPPAPPPPAQRAPATQSQPAIRRPVTGLDAPPPPAPPPSASARPITAAVTPASLAAATPSALPAAAARPATLPNPVHAVSSPTAPQPRPTTQPATPAVARPSTSASSASLARPPSAARPGALPGRPIAPRTSTGTAAAVVNSRPAPTAEQLQRFGVSFLNALVRALKVLAMHRADNAAATQALEELTNLGLKGVQVLGEVRLQWVDGTPFLNHEPLRMRDAGADAAAALVRVYERLGIDEVAFLPDLERQDVEAFARVFQSHILGSDPKAIVQVPLAHVQLRAIVGLAAQNLTRPQLILRLYARLVVQLDDAVTGGEGIPVERFRRLLQRLSDASVGHEPLLVGLTRFPREGNEVGHHAAAVSVLTMLLGRRLEVPRSVQMELALAGLLHDLGRTTLADRPDVALDAQAQALLTRRLPLETALRLVHSPVRPRPLDRALCAFEAAQLLSAQPTPGMLARLVAVPSAFDLLTQPPRPRRGVAPDRALRLLIDRVGSRFDGRVVKLFVQTVGLYPVGTLVRLSGGQLAVVLEVPTDERKASLPKVKVIEERGQPADRLLDLGAPNQPLRVATSVDASELQVNPASFLFG